MAYHAFPTALPGGFVGVDIFFVISGFLITKIVFEKIRQEDFSLIDFYQGRIRRLFPSLVIVLSASLVLGWHLLLADEYKQLGKHIAASFSFVLNFVLHQEIGYFNNAAETKPLLHLWSLSVEEQFYLVWPAVLWAATKYWPRVTLLTVVWGCSLLVGSLLLLLPAGAASYYLPLPRFLEILLGAFLASQVHDRKYATSIFESNFVRHLELRLPVTLIGFFLIGAALFTINKEMSYPGWATLLPAFGALLVIAAGEWHWLNRKILGNPILVWIGQISYPLYLWHWLALSFAFIVEDQTPPAEIRAMALVVSTALAWVTCVLFEKPLRQGAAGRAKAALLLVLAAALLCTGFYVFQNEGIKSRPIELQNPVHIFGAPYRKSCSDLTQEEYSDDWCSQGNAGRQIPDIVMIGDSYANAYSTMLGAYLESRGNPRTFIQFGRGLCPMVVDYGPAHCRRMTQMALDFIARQDRVKTVIVAARWPAYYGGKAAWTGHRESPEAFRAAQEKTIDQLQKNGKKVVVLLAPPTGATPRMCVYRGIGSPTDTQCDLKRSKAERRDGDYRNQLIRLLNSKKIPYFDAFNFLCDKETCTVMSGQKVLYTDGEHLSTFGGEYLARQALDTLDHLLLK